MRARIGLTVLAAVAGIVASAAPASAAPIDDCRGLRLVCIFADPNHGGAVVWTGIEWGSYNAPYRTRTTGTNVVNSTGDRVQIRSYTGGRGCYVPNGWDINLPSGINDNIGRIVIGSDTGGLPRC
ncbi:hypothetical protein G7043_35385 [Lentzea sp. NEAU-D13]|uniref:Peptidase inhibitor family I36 n=1 Tax=Lentzea alba TaxID=2714351 RepID=A0A7C9RVX3_9PSEU|nr:hypothetical protein [Lentzea alba]NGY64209.1 hypothetical protein [Lentzea alba]